MDTLSLSDRAWPKDSSQESDGADKQARNSAKDKGKGRGLFARARRIPAQLHTKKWIFNRESTRVDSEIPVTISGIAEDGHLFSEQTRTLDVSKRGAKIASSTLLAVGTYLWIESPNMQKPTVARVVRHGTQQDSVFEICVTLPEIDEAESIWNIESAPDDWKKSPEEPSAARRLERIYARDWVTKFESLSKAPTLPSELASELEPSRESPTPFAQSAATGSEFKMQPGKILEFVMGEPARPASAAVPTFGRSEERTFSPSDQMREAPASDVEVRLAKLTIAMESLERRVGALIENFQGRIESSLQAVQGRGANHAEELERVARELGGQWAAQFQKQAEAALAKLREELQSSSQTVEQSKQQLASLAEAKLASLSQATQDEYAQRLAQGLRDQTQEMHAAADGEVNSIRQAAAEVIAELQVKLEQQAQAVVTTLREELQSSTQAVEQSKQQLASLAEAKLASLSQATQDEYAKRLAQGLRDQTQEMHAAADGEVSSIRQAAAEVIAELQVKLEQQAQAVVTTLREELQSSTQAVEQSKRQLASLAEAKLASLSQATQDEYVQRLAQALRDQTQEMHAAADGEVASIRKAAAEAIATLREELQSSSQAVEQSKQQLASLAEAKLASLSQTTRDEYAQRLEQALRDQTKEMHAAADGEVASIRQAAAEAIATLREELKSSSQAVEQSKQQLASLAEARLASLSQASQDEYAQRLAQALRDQTQEMHAAADGEVKSIKQATAEAIAQLRAVERTRESNLLSRAEAAEERLTGVTSAVEALKGRVGQLTEELEGQHAAKKEDLEGTAQQLGARWSQQFQEQAAAAVEALRTRMTALAEDFQATQTRKSEDLERVSGELEARCSQRIQEQAKAAVQRLREEAKSSGQIVEETKKQLAGLAQSSLAAAGQVNPAESSPLLAQALQEQVQQIQAAADAQVNAIKQAAQDAIAEAQVAGQKREEDFLARTGVAEERLKAVSLAVESLTESVHAGGLQGADLDNVAQELGNRMTQQFEKQTELAVEKVRAEVRTAGRAVEELARQLSGLAETKRASLNQVATNAAAGFEAQQRKLKMQFETARKDLEDLVARRMARISVGAIHSPGLSDRKGAIVKLAVGAGLFLIMVASLLAVSLSTHTVMQLRNDAPTEFADDNPTWNAKRRDREHEVAQAYWRVAAVTLQAKYPFGSDLPAEPPADFQVDSAYDPPGGPKALADLRLHYWDSVRAAWHQHSFWVEIQEPDTTWSARFHDTWERIKGK